MKTRFAKAAAVTAVTLTLSLGSISMSSAGVRHFAHQVQGLGSGGFLGPRNEVSNMNLGRFGAEGLGSGGFWIAPSDLAATRTPENSLHAKTSGLGSGGLLGRLTAFLAVALAGQSGRF